MNPIILIVALLLGILILNPYDDFSTFGFNQTDVEQGTQTSDYGCEMLPLDTDYYGVYDSLFECDTAYLSIYDQFGGYESGYVAHYCTYDNSCNQYIMYFYEV
jgi:hypothetical protein